MSDHPSEPAPSNDAASDLEELRQAVLTDWLRVTSSVTDSVNEMQNTLSWRVTKPFRLTRMLQKKAQEVGVVQASQLSAAALAERLGRRR